MENEKILAVVVEFFAHPKVSLEEELKKRNLDKFDREIIRKSIDSRQSIRILYRVKLLLPEKMATEMIALKKAEFYENPFDMEIEKKESDDKIFVIGAGPSGLFAAYHLLLSGKKVVLIEQGKRVEDREKDVSVFWNDKRLNEFSNIQNGEGGAGTFSDGKLGTRVKSPIKTWIYKKMVDFGAPEEIMYLSKPHIGTDKLKVVMINFRQELINLGCEIRFNTQLIDIDVSNEKINSIVLKNTENGTEIAEKCDNLFLGIGNSSRRIFELLMRKNIATELKPFAVGYRVIHFQKTIDENQYGFGYEKYNLPASEYALTNKINENSVYSFCMCPGGIVVNSASENNTNVTNGMSNNKRDSGFANSAIVVNINPDFFGNDVKKAILFQQEIEKRGYDISGSYNLPAMEFSKFIGDKKFAKNVNIIEKIEKQQKAGKQMAVEPSFILKNNLKDLYSDYDFINNSIAKSLGFWDRKIKKFGSDGLIVVGPETRTSSPIRILRDETFESINIKGLYPIGEGAGYAGGITSSAIDGVKASMAFVKKS